MNVGILGFGNVAAATLESFLKNQELIQSKSRTPIQFVHIATRTPAKAHKLAPSNCLVDNNLHGLVENPNIHVVIELTGNVPLGRTLVLQALQQGKHVITANKALLAQHGEEIMTTADAHNRRVLFEGAVAVSIPIVKTLREAAAANHISSIMGILNGTSNYVLSQMSEHDSEFSTALTEAQRRGYAEADPTMDINGEDAAHKITLLASLAFGIPVHFDHVRYQGITNIHRIDIKFAKRLGHQIKLIAQAQHSHGGKMIRVCPTLVPNQSMLAQVNGSMNGIMLHGDLLGDAFLYGSGAGGRQTASAVLADLLELANLGHGETNTGAYNMGFRHHRASAHSNHYSEPDISEPFYIRVSLDDKAGSLAKVSQVLAGAGISVHALLQDGPHEEQSDLVIITHPISNSLVHKTMPLLQDAAGQNHTLVVLPVLASSGEKS